MIVTMPGILHNRLDMDETWIGKTEESTEVLTLNPVHKLAATLDKLERFQEGDVLPAGWQWLFFTPTVPMAETGIDGHAKRGGFLPPIELPRRMWAGGRFTCFYPLKIGQEVHKKSTVASISEKEGKSGKLVFVLVRHEFTNADGLALVEEQDIVYREAPSANQPPPARKAAPAEAQWSKQIFPNPVLLFRYSALTFNSHRIHYDLKYCLEEEGYPGLVVHGPLIATLLLELLPEGVMEQFSFKAVSPLFDTHPFLIEGRQDGEFVTLWALNHERHLAMEARAKMKA